MSEEAREQISALMDGEVSADRRVRLVDKLLSEPELVKAWERYNLISDVLRNNLCDAALSPTVSQQKTIALSGAMGKKSVGTKQIPSVSEDPSPSYVAKQVTALLRQEPVVLRRRSPIPLRPALGFALAASVAIVAVLGVQQMTEQPLEGDQAPPLQATASPQNELVTAASTTDLEQASRARLTSYLVNYSEYLDNGMRGLLPYARIVSQHDANNP